MSKRVLKGRHVSGDRQVAQVKANIETLVPREELDQLAEQTVEAMKLITRGHKTAFAWSGGKDSLVLTHLMHRAGIPTTGLLGITRHLEYPAMAAWYEQNVPPGVEIIRSGEDLTWLQAHPKHIFSTTSPEAGYWAANVWLLPQRRYCEQHGSTMLILGRRKLDGNYCGPDGSGLYCIKGVWRYLPIVRWSQEEVLAYLHYYDLYLPPVYSWVHGFKVGTHPWPARQAILDEEDGWAQVHSCDPSIIVEAAKYLPGARSYLMNPMPIKSLNMHVWAGRRLG